jgi:hypothetical protein
MRDEIKTGVESNGIGSIVRSWHDSDFSRCSGMSAAGESGRVIVEEHFGF